MRKWFGMTKSVEVSVCLHFPFEIRLWRLNNRITVLTACYSVSETHASLLVPHRIGELFGSLHQPSGRLLWKWCNEDDLLEFTSSADSFFSPHFLSYCTACYMLAFSSPLNSLPSASSCVSFGRKGVAFRRYGRQAWISCIKLPFWLFKQDL